MDDKIESCLSNSVSIDEQERKLMNRLHNHCLLEYINGLRRCMNQCHPSTYWQLFVSIHVKQISCNYHLYFWWRRWILWFSRNSRKMYDVTLRILLPVKACSGTIVFLNLHLKTNRALHIYLRITKLWCTWEQHREPFPWTLLLASASHKLTLI